MALNFTTTITGTATETDRRAGRHVIQEENARRAALTPPVAPLPFANDAQLAASYKILMEARQVEFHLYNLAMAKRAKINELTPLLDAATEAQLQAVINALS